MQLRDDELRKYRVETVDGNLVGRVVGCVVDMESGTLVQLRVRPRGAATALFPGTRELLIGFSQIVRIEPRCVIVGSGSVAEVNENRRHIRVHSEQRVAASAPL
ncbi:MAG: PRC-barrel domain-containing protein, partial [Candidatus Uhrbacteria bacterium]